MNAKFKVLFLVLLFIRVGQLYAQPVITISASSGLADVGTKAGTFLDEKGTITAGELAGGKYDGQFANKGQEVVNYGITKGISWCRFRLVSSSDEKVFLSVHNPIADTIWVYKIVNGNAVQIGINGLAYPVSTRQVRTEDNMFHLQAGTDTATYLVGIRTFRNHAYSLKAGTLKAHMANIHYYTLWNAAFLGFALLMALYNLFLFIAIRNIPYLHYVGYVLAFGLFNAFLNGTAYLYFWPSHPEWNQYDNVVGSIVGVFTGLFTMTFLGLRKHAPGYHKIALVIVCMFGTNALISLAGFPFASFVLLHAIVIISFVYTIAAGYKVLRSGYRPALFFLLAWSIVVIGILVFLLHNLNLVGYSFLAERSMQIATLIEALILSFALADRFNRYKKEKEALILSQNEMLEHKVAERTEELKKQQQETEQLLLNILPEEVAAELKEKGAAQSRNYEAVTVLFTDFKDFTRIVENISPEQLIAQLNSCFSAFDKIIEKYGIEKIKTIGDSYMCAGGFGANDPLNALNVVRAGIEIRDFMNARNNEAAQRNGIILEVRIGIHTGPVIAGIVGIKKFAYDIWGDTVNIASRMESAGETGKVNISGITYEIVKNDFICTHRGKMPAKNKGDVDMYFVEWQ